MQPNDVSLDEYIRMKKVNDGVGLLTMRKHRVQVDENILNRDLDTIAEEMAVDRFGQSGPNSSQNFLDRNLDDYIRNAAISPSNASKSGLSTCSRFNRKSLRDDRNSDDEEEEEDEDNLVKIVEDDVEMLEELDKIFDDNERERNDNFNFRTIEAENGIKVRSQQWRLRPENVVHNRPEGMNRLECIPLGPERFLRHPRSGRVSRFSQRSTSRSSNFQNANNLNIQSIIQGAEVHGQFVEKSGFTYKFGQRCGSASNDLIGIERNREISVSKPIAIPRRNFSLNHQNPAPVESPQPQININFNITSMGKQTAENDDDFNAESKVHEAEKIKAQALRLLKMIETTTSRNLKTEI